MERQTKQTQAVIITVAQILAFQSGNILTYSQRGANLNASQLTYKYARAETNCNLTIGLSGESKMSERVEQKQLAKPDEWSPAKLTLGKRIGKDFRVNWQLYVMFVLPVIYYIIFRYIPMFGNILAFRKYTSGGNIFGEGPLTLKYFKQFITGKPFWQAFSNTLILNGLYLLFRFPLTLIFALLLNEIRNLHWKKFVQTVSYLPHFISMVIVCGMIKELLSTSGPINDVIARLGGEKISFISLAEWFRTIFVASGVWQSLGWGTILYLAAMSGINPSLYEAATVDGANHFQQVLHVTIPCILPTIATLLILDIGGLVGSGGAFEKVYLLYSPLTYETSDIVSTYVFRMGIESGSINFATAVGMFEGIINLILLTIANFVSRKVANTSLW